MPFDSLSHMCWAIFRMGFKFFAESLFIYLIVNNINNQNVCEKSNTLNKKKMFLFTLFYTSVVLTVYILALRIYAYNVFLFRSASVSLVFFYACYKQREIQENLVSSYNNAQNIRYALTTAIILSLAAESFNYISYMLIHKSFILMGIYGTVHDIDILHQLYRTLAVFLNAFIMFLVYKFRFINMKDIKNMSIHKRIPISFAFCLISFLYIEFVFDKIFSLARYREILLWLAALTLPSYIGFYLITTKLTRLLSVKANHTANRSIRMWILNPSVIEVAHLDVYNSDVFMSNFESKRFEFERMLNKLGITDECKGYSELVFCLFLTRLFIGLKGWRFEREIFEQASLIIDVSIPKLRKNMEDIIEQVWTTNDARTLIDGYYRPCHNINTYDQTQRPTVEQFLTDVAKSI